MPSPYLKKLSSQGYGALEVLERKWAEAKDLAAQQGQDTNWGYVTQVFKNMVGVKAAQYARLKIAGHGYVVGSAAGRIAKCGGPGVCASCNAEVTEATELLEAYVPETPLLGAQARLRASTS